MEHDQPIHNLIACIAYDLGQYNATYDIDKNYIEFATDDDYTLFMLRWG